MRITIKCGIVKLTKRKKQLLDQEYNNLQKFLHGENVPLYSANKQQAKRYYKKIKPNKEYPLSLRKDIINLKKSKSFWFLKVPVYGIKGGIKVPIKPHREIPDNAKLCESEIIKRRGKYIAHLVFDVEPPPKRNPSVILAIDLGERFAATAVLWQQGIKKVKFYGKQIRGIRRHYSWLRKRLQERKLMKVLKRIGSKERRIVTDILHKISKEILELANLYNAVIVLGDLKGIRKSAKGKGKRLNRIIHNMPYYKLTWMIQYKAELRGIPVEIISEAYTSKTCCRCGAEGKRKTQGLFVCSNCGEYNADLNGAVNIAKKFERSPGCMLGDGAVSEPALNGAAYASSRSPMRKLGVVHIRIFLNLLIIILVLWRGDSPYFLIPSICFGP